jgi:hypothetical protein
MTQLENDLGEAFESRAGRVPFDTAAYDAILTRRGRRLRRRWTLVPVAATAAVATVVGLASLPRDSRPAPAPPVGPVAAPSRFMTFVWSDVRVREADGSGDVEVTGPAGYVPTAVAAVGDGRTFYVAWRQGQGCAARIDRVEATGSGVTTSPVAELDGSVTELAVSRDGERLAYGVRRPAADPNCGAAAIGTVPELRVRAVSGGKEQVWPGRTGESKRAQHLMLSHLSFGPDGRHVAFLAHDCCAESIDDGIRVLDTSGDDESFLDPPTVRLPGTGGCRTEALAYRGRHDALAVVLRCGGQRDVVAADPATGAVGDRLFELPANKRGAWGGFGMPRLAFDPSGDHALLAENGIEWQADILRWDGGALVSLPDLPAIVAVW